MSEACFVGVSVSFAKHVKFDLRTIEKRQRRQLRHSEAAVVEEQRMHSLQGGASFSTVVKEPSFVVVT